MKLVMLIQMCLNETHNEDHIDKHLSDMFQIENGLRKGDALSPLHFDGALYDAIRKVQENQGKLKINRIHQLLVYAHDVNLLGDE
jgi:hypothetical protein